MKTFKCIKLDMLKSKSIFKFLPFFLLICLVTTLASNNAPACWGILYLVFGGLIIVSNPFFAMSNISEVFTNMLPASVADRVFGRYLFGVTVMVVSALLGVASEFFRMMVKGEISMKGIWVFTAVFLGAALIVMAVEFLVLYFVTIRNAQILSIVRMVPAFVLFFGASALMDAGAAEGGPGGMLQWITRNMTVLSLGILAAGMLFTLLCAVISWLHEKSKY